TDLHAITHRRGPSDRNIHAQPDANPYGDTDRHRDPDRDSYGTTDLHFDGNADLHFDANRDLHTDGNPDLHTDGYTACNDCTDGFRTRGAASTGTCDLDGGGVTANAWHHHAASFQSATPRTLTVYIGGEQRAQGTITSAPSSNTLPVIVGRSGASGEYWFGNI